MTKRDVARIGDLLGTAGKKFRIDDPRATGELWRRWHEIVGGDVARHAEPTSLKEGVLRVRTTTPAWATEITYLAEDIRGRVNSALGKTVVREIKVWTSSAPIKAARVTEQDRSSGADKRVAKARANDPEDALRRAFEAWSKRRRTGSR